MGKKRTRRPKTGVQADDVRRVMADDPLRGIESQSVELINRIIELRSLAPVLSEAQSTVRTTEARIRTLRTELHDIQNALLADLPAEGRYGPPVEVPSARRSVRVPLDVVVDAVPDDAPLDDDDLDTWQIPDNQPEVSTDERFFSPLSQTGLSTDALGACNRAGLLTVAKVVEWHAAGAPFSSIRGIDPVQERELQELVRPYLDKIPAIQRKLGML